MEYKTSNEDQKYFLKSQNPEILALFLAHFLSWMFKSISGAFKNYTGIYFLGRLWERGRNVYQRLYAVSVSCVQLGAEFIQANNKI